MKVITAADKHYMFMAENLAKSCKRHYDVIINKLDDMVDHSRFIKECHYKIDFIEEAINKYNEDIAWIDADCLLLNKLCNPLSGCDVGVTLRRKGLMDLYFTYSGLLNAGVIFFHNCNNTKKFLKLWRAELPNGKWRTDQEALNVVTGVKRRNKPGNILYNGDIKIRILSCDEYNFFYFPEAVDKDKVKVLHFKGDTRKYYNEYAKALVG